MGKQFQYLDPRVLAKMANLNLIARLVVEGFITGLHRSPYQGFSVEFSEYRKYCPGDDVKIIDWKAYAKSDKFYVKQYQEETNLRCFILLDSSASMAYTSDGLSKFQYSCYAAASLAYLLVRQKDSVGLAIFDEKIEEYISPKSSTQRLRDILRALENTSPTQKTNVSGAFHELAERIKRRALIIVFSDLFDDPESVIRGLAHFRHKKHEVIVFHVLDPAEVDFPFENLTEFIDLETEKRIRVYPRIMRERYLERFGHFVAHYKQKCAEHSIEYVRMNIDTPLDLALIRYLSKRSRLG